MSRTFRFVDPDNGGQIVAAWTTAADFTITRLTPGLCEKKKHNMKATLCITQWGFDRQRDIAVFTCKRCGLSWAFRLVTFDDPETQVETSLETDGTPAA